MLTGAILPDHMIHGLSRSYPNPRYHVYYDEDQGYTADYSYCFDGEIVPPLLIDPFYKAQLQAASYDVRLAREIRTFTSLNPNPIDLKSPDHNNRTQAVDISSGFLLMPGKFVLGATVEQVRIPPWLVCRVDGKSGLARVGLQIHSAGFIDPGYYGNITLEIVNLGEHAIVLWPDVLIAQLEFIVLTSPCVAPYDGKHQGGVGAVDSQYTPKIIKIPESMLADDQWP